MTLSSSSRVQATGERAAKMVDSMADSAPPAVQKYIKMTAPAVKMIVIGVATVAPHVIFAYKKAREVFALSHSIFHQKNVLTAAVVFSLFRCTASFLAICLKPSLVSSFVSLGGFSPPFWQQLKVG
jgi:hypothetical protein